MKHENLMKLLENSKSPFIAEFNVHYDLMGLAIGAHHINIKQARRIDGITSIELDKDTGCFKIYGEVIQFYSTLVKISNYLIFRRKML